MLKTRIIPILLFKGRTIVKSKQFAEMRMVGDPTTCARVFNERNSDELMFLDIMATRNKTRPNFKVIEDISKECFMPLTIGGGIKTMQDVDELFNIGADKICINSAFVENPEFVSQIAKKYGTQAIVVSIDAKKENGKYATYIDCGQKKTNYDPVELAKLAEKYGAGEILINSIDNDGVMNGYDLELIKQVSQAVSLPILAAGGCGKLQDFVDAAKAGASALCAASIFLYVGESIITAKNHLNKHGIPVRLS